MIAPRLMLGAISLSRLSHLPPMAASMLIKPVRLVPGRANKAGADRIRDDHKHNGDGRSLVVQRSSHRRCGGDDHIGLLLNHLLGKTPRVINIGIGPPQNYPRIVTI